MTTKIFALLGCLFAFLGVAFGAFGAHALKDRLSPPMLAAFEIGVRYQMYHALGLFAVESAMTGGVSPYAAAAGWSMVGGIVIFSGSLYLLSFTGIKAWGAITPLGGILFLISWTLLLWAFVKQP